MEDEGANQPPSDQNPNEGSSAEPKHSAGSSASGRKSRNLREATYHLREEALRRYREHHKGDDPPLDWKPSDDEQYDIIRALSPPGQDPDPSLLAARFDGAFENLGTPRGTPLNSENKNTPTIIYETHVDSSMLEERAPTPDDFTEYDLPSAIGQSVMPNYSTYLKPVDFRQQINKGPDGAVLFAGFISTGQAETQPTDPTTQEAGAQEAPSATPAKDESEPAVDITAPPVESQPLESSEAAAESSTAEPAAPAAATEPAEDAVAAGSADVPDKEAEKPGDEPKKVSEEAGGEVPATEVTGGEVPAAEETGGEVPATEETGGEVPATEETGGEVPATMETGEEIPAAEEAGSEVAGNKETGGDVPATEEAEAQPKSTAETADKPADGETATDGEAKPAEPGNPADEEPAAGTGDETVTESANKDDESAVKDGESAAKEGESAVKEGESAVKEGEVTTQHSGTADKPAEAAKAPEAGAMEEGADVSPAQGGEELELPDGTVQGDDPDIRGDEASVASDEVKKDNKPAIPDDFFYDYDNLVSKPRITEESGLPENMLQLSHSFGYDCRRRGNLCVLDARTIAYVAGNLVQIVDIVTKEQKYIRSTGGVAIGAICLHPSRKWLAIAEKGDAPDINIYEYETLRLHRILRGGTQQQYAYVCFSPDGKLLASVGGEPDFMLTLWNWKDEQTMLRSKAFSQDVFRVSFSTELEGQLTSSGTGHIRFWKMAHTFTGLKLQGQLGKFGKTEISDIEGYVELPDGKVLSGCENGNLLLWDGGLIKVEISRKGKKPCHHGPIQQIIMDEGELMSVGEDGWIRVWDFEAVDTADSTDETGLFEMEPMNEIKIGQSQEHVSLRSIVKSTDDEEEPTIWYAQDANGGIWKLDLSFSHTSATPERLMYYHAGAIAGCSTSPVSHLVATTGVDKTVRVHDYINNVTLCESLLNSEGTSVIWAPKLVDTKGATILAGFGDGVVRSFILSKKADQNRKGVENSELLLSQVFKPHVKAVTSMAFDHTGETLATGSEDGTVFFFNVSNKEYQPIGFVPVAGGVTHISWSPGSYEKTTLLVCCSNGFAQEIDCPEPGSFDTSHSYQIENIGIKTHQFKSVKSELRHEEELEQKRLEEEAAKKKKDEDRRLRIERGLVSESDDEEEEENAKKEEEEEWKPYIPTTPSSILYGYYSKEQPGTFWLSMDDFDAGYLYQCEFKEEEEIQKIPSEERYQPMKAIAVEGLADTPISVMHFSDTHQQVLCGTQTGVIRAQPLTGDDLMDTSTYWELSMHDNHQGNISAIEVSFDGAFVITVGNDGNFFVYKYMSQKDVDAEVVKAKIPSAFKLAPDQKLPDDIDDPHAYSIEDAKQKAEHDKMMREAEERKQEVRRIITQLRRQFRKLLEKNHELPVHLRLGVAEFEMDPEIKKELARHTQEKIDTVKKELAWESEKQQIALDKLKMRFKAMIETERIVVKSFKTSYEVATYRAPKLSDDSYLLKAELERRRNTAISKAQTDLSRDASLLNAREDGGEARKDSAGGGDGSDDLAAKTQTNLKGAMGQRIQKALQKVENKKRKRAARKAEWADLLNSKPDDDYEDPEDVEAIAEAQHNMGDYKLKTADDYVVPDHLRMNVEKAIMKLLVLKELIHEVKYGFNKRVLALRDQKMTIIDQITQYVTELMDIKSTLGEDKCKPIPSIPTMHPDELPERKMDYTRESLLEFKAEMEKQALLAKTGGDQGGFGGFGGGGGGGADKKIPLKRVKSSKMRVVSRLVANISSAKPTTSSTKFANSNHHKDAQKTITADKESVPAEDSLDSLLEKRAITPTPLEIQMRLAQEIRSAYQQDYLLGKIDEMVGMFDAELRCLYFDKLKLDVDLKNADLRYITLFEEFLLLKEYEKHENTLGTKLAVKQQEKIDQQTKALEITQKIELKKKDIEKLQEKERALHAMFVQSMGDNNKFSDYLTKVFKKKIKRAKKKENAGQDSDDESEEESSDDEDWSESDEESGSEGGGYDLDICPPGCDQTLYNNTTQLREKRLDIEEVLTEEKKNRDQLVKDSENITKKTKVILAGLKSAEADLEAFQLEKQQKLNEFDIVVTLNLHQILHNEHGRLPNDLQQCLVFNSPDIVKLSHRIKELEHEKAIQKRQQKDNKKKHVQLIKDRKLFDGKITELDSKCNEEMILKFGRIVDLEALEQVTVNRQVEELKEKLRTTEIECSEDLKRWEEKIRKRKDKITSLIRENTNRIETLNMMQTEKRDLQLQLDSKQKSLGGEFSGARKADLHERQRLIQLVQLQAQEVDALKEEIVMLSHKGGHILPPAQPPIPGEPRHPTS